MPPPVAAAGGGMPCIASRMFSASRFESATSSASTWAKMTFRTFSGSGMFSNTESPVSPADSIVTVPLFSIRATRFCSKLTLFTRLSGIETPRRRKKPL